jgi:hypothetical protein
MRPTIQCNAQCTDAAALIRQPPLWPMQPKSRLEYSRIQSRARNAAVRGFIAASKCVFEVASRTSCMTAPKKVREPMS